MPPLRLSPRAEARLTEILLWSFEKFGPVQAERCKAELMQRCAAIAAGTAVSRDATQLAGVPAAEELRFTRAGEHYIAFVEDRGEIVVFDFIHVRMDLPGQIDALTRRL